MDIEIIHYLKSCKLFYNLGDEGLKKITSGIIKLELRPNDILFCQGSPADSVYILIKGEMVAMVTQLDHSNQLLRHIEPNETIGELSALTGEPHPFTIKATKSCTLLRLPNNQFKALCFAHPEIMYAAVHPVLSHTDNLLKMMSLEKNKQSIVLIPANKHVTLLPKFVDKFINMVSRIPNLFLISDYHNEFSDLTPETLKQTIHDLEKEHKQQKIFLYLLKNSETPLADLALKKGDQVYIIGDGNSSPAINPDLLEGIQHRTSHFKAYPELILLHHEQTMMPSNTTDWLNLTKFHLHHHVRINSSRDYLRLLRFLQGKPHSLVLGGGGTRGWAHIGVLKALHEDNIPIDIIGGTSVGAIVGACYALNGSYEDTYEKFKFVFELSRQSVSWRNLTWPIISLFNAKNFTLSQQNAFHDLLIENTWLPYFCISSNLANYAEYVHRSGLIWEKTRASSSMPGLIPPMVIDGELHLDGGLLNNLPVDVMRQLIGKDGKIIAVELNSSQGDRRQYNFPPIFTFREAFLARNRKKSDTYRLPRLLDTFMRGVLVGSAAKTRQNSLMANVLVNLNLNKFRLLHSSHKQAAKMIELGYAGMKEQLEKNQEMELI